METKYVEMICNLSEHIVGEIVHPEGFQVKHLRDAREDELYSCYYGAFQAGDAPFFFAQSERERREFFDTLGYVDALTEPASLILLKNDQLVGFTYVLPYGDGNRHISCMCIRPDFQSRGLGLFLLRLVMRTVAQGGLKSITLGTGTCMRAYRLYSMNGFKEKETDL